MAGKDKAQRRQRRAAVKAFHEGFDFERLDYHQRCRPLRGKALLAGVVVAGLLYCVGFALGYFGWQQQSVSTEQFAKLVWILMVPATMLGGLVWLLKRHRLEYILREDIRRYISEREGEHGWLWCFTPLQEALLTQDYTARRVMQLSRQSLESLDPEDYARTVTALHEHLQREPDKAVTTERAGQVLANIQSRLQPFC